jgi:hypothetical protein
LENSLISSFLFVNTLIHFKEFLGDCVRYILKYILSNLVYVTETAMGISVHAQRGGQVEYIKAVKRSGEYTTLFPSDFGIFCCDTMWYRLVILHSVTTLGTSRTPALPLDTQNIC